MSDPPSYDQDLLARLNALKKSTITLDTTEYVRRNNAAGQLTQLNTP